MAVVNGTAYGWGQDVFGEVGDGTIGGDRHPVAPVIGLSSGVTAVSGGYYHSLALVNGSVYAWGYNAYGQLGDGTTTTRGTPAVVPGLTSGVTAISAGQHDSLAVMDGSAYAWGQNQYGQLGNGTTTDSLTAVLVGGIPDDVTEVVAEYYGSFALTADHRLFAWGDNSLGEFGNGMTTSSLTPVEVFAPGGYYFSSLSGSVDSAVAILTPVPEPSALLLTTGAAVAFLARRRFVRRR